ncbi:MAG: orotidine-5'-phosphate decarboxylase [Bacillota bacterium]|nr:orotidine-5'-phosphate decarboxylase [Bacillota bacterium]
MKAIDRLIVALDVSTASEAIKIIDALEDTVKYYKVGMQLYNSVGPKMAEELLTRGKKVFIDLKFHDIPNTASQAGAVFTRMGVTMFNVHVAGGYKMMKATVDTAAEVAISSGIERPKIIGVTVLTSLSQEEFNNEIGFNGKIIEKVRAWSSQAQEAGLDGVVASAQELPIIRQACGPDFIVVTPGIRPAWAASNDQQRIVTPKEAMQLGASQIVVGRPIYGSSDPKEAARKILAEMEEGLC